MEWRVLQALQLLLDEFNETEQLPDHLAPFLPEFISWVGELADVRGDEQEPTLK